MPQSVSIDQIVSTLISGKNKPPSGLATYSGLYVYDYEMILDKYSGEVGWFASRCAARLQPKLGAYGEWIALRYLRQKNWDILARNWKTSHGEVDLIAHEDSSIVFIEVKTRRGPSLLPPEANVDEDKKDQLERLAYSFLNRYELLGDAIRFDLIAIEVPGTCRNYKIRHYKGFM